MSALSSLTISSAIIMSIFMIVAIVIRGITRHTFPYVYCGVLAIVWIISNIPWLSAGILNSSLATVSSDTIAMYRIRPDSVFGLVGTTLSLAGIWNRFALTPLRDEIYFSVLQTVVITGFFLVGIFVLYRKTRIWLSRDQSRRQHDNSIVILTIIATSVVVVVAVIFSGTSWGSRGIYYAVQSVPGAGVLRDSQKFLAIALPGYALAIAGTFQWIKNIATYQFVVLLGLFVICFSDGFIANWKTLRSIHYPPDFQIARELVSMHSGDVVSLPAGIMRSYDFTDGVASIDPLPRMLPANVRTSGMVYIDGHPVDSSPSSGSIIEAQVLSARDVSDLEKLPISWIIVTRCPGYWGNFPHLAHQLTPAYQGHTLTIYQISHTHPVISHHVSTLQLSSSIQTYRWRVMIIAHFLWFTMIIFGMLIAICSLGKQAIATIRAHNKIIE